MVSLTSFLYFNMKQKTVFTNNVGHLEFSFYLYLFQNIYITHNAGLLSPGSTIK